MTLLGALGIVGGAGTALSAVGSGLRWLYNKAKRIDDTFEYVDELRTNHVPHLQVAVEAIADKVGVDLKAAYSQAEHQLKP